MTASNYLSQILDNPIHTVNKILNDKCGVNNFFVDQPDLAGCIACRTKAEQDEYGDWQTNLSLAIAICEKLKNDGIDPEIIIEPTCGKGNFIIAALMVFDNIKEVYGIEIYKPYVDEVKYQILQFYLNNDNGDKPEFNIYHENIFDFDIKALKDKVHEKRTLLIGNPPWVTNGKLGELNSNNLPIKSNFKKHSGLESITGKGNFDISEYIMIQLLKTFCQENVQIAFLLKNSVIKNIVHDQQRMKYPIALMKQHNIDAKKEFNVSVDASLFQISFGNTCSMTCNIYDFYKQEQKGSYGWHNGHFVSDIEKYAQCKDIEGTSQLTWWSGIKHDCAAVMELDYANGQLYNSLKEAVIIEDDIIYPLLKSSDLHSDNNPMKRKKYVIVTQKHTSENTLILKAKSPLAYSYLEKHAERLDNRGSRIYRSRPRFCIFGIGEYSFMKYKVAISGLYKVPKFQLITPINGRPVMLDDTCYALGFNNLNIATIVHKILNSDLVLKFIESIMFSDAKRSITKELLMRIDLAKAAESIGYMQLGINKEEFDEFINYIRNHHKTGQGLLF